MCTSDPRNVLRMTAVLSSRSRKPELDFELDLFGSNLSLGDDPPPFEPSLHLSRMAVAVIAADLSSVEAPKAKRSTDFYLIFFGQTGGAVTV